MAGSHVGVERPARRRRRRERHNELAAGACVRIVAAMAYGLCQDAESAPTPAGTIMTRRMNNVRDVGVGRGERVGHV